MNPNALTLIAGFLCPLFFIGFIVVAIILTIRRARAARSAPGGSSLPSAVPTELAQDGFWIVSCPADPGSIIYYHYWSAGARYSGRIPFQPAADRRQFVYTGRRPDQVSIVRIVSVAVDDDDGLTDTTLIPPIIAAGATWDPSDDSSAPSAPSPSSSPSFPSAY